MNRIPVFVTCDIESCKLRDYGIVISFLHLEITFHSVASQQNRIRSRQIQSVEWYSYRSYL